jgi:3-methylcrotonyl-CoA carboxylase alpha subunit
VTGGVAPSASGRIIEMADGAVVITGGRQHHVALMRHDTLDPGQLGDDGVVRAPMNGRLVAVFVVPGQAVKKGARVALMEAMKMEHSLTAPMDGTVAEVAAVAGAQAIEGAALVRIEADEVEAS